MMLTVIFGINLPEGNRYSSGTKMEPEVLETSDFLWLPQVQTFQTQPHLIRVKESAAAISLPCQTTIMDDLSIQDFELFRIIIFNDQTAYSTRIH